MVIYYIYIYIYIPCIYILYIYIYIYIYRERERGDGGANKLATTPQLHDTPVSRPAEALQKDTPSENQITEGASDINEGALTLMHIYLTYHILSSPLL